MTPGSAHHLNSRPSAHFWLQRFPVALDLLTAFVLLLTIQAIVDGLHTARGWADHVGLQALATFGVLFPTLIVAGGLAVGVAAEQMRCAWSARIVRGVALLSAAVFFFFTAIWFGVITNAALGGGAYLFIAARCAMAAYAHLVDWTAIVRDQ